MNERPGDRFGTIMRLRLLQDVMDVATDRAGADYQGVGDFSVGTPQRDETEDLQLAGREIRRRPVVEWGAACSPEFESHVFRTPEELVDRLAQA